MAKEMLLGLFDNVETTAEVLRQLDETGVKHDQITVMSSVPYSSKILGRKHPRSWFLPFVLAGALGGLAIGLFIVAVTPQLYRTIVGGQPLTPFPPSAILVVEFIALGSMVAGFIGFLLQNRFPILTRQIYDPRITEGYIGVQVQVGETLADRTVSVFEANRAIDIKREDASAYPPQGQRHLLFWGAIGVAGLGAFLVPLLLTFDIIHLPWFNTMKHSPAVGYQEGPRLAAPAAAVPIQGPVLIAGQPATAPLPSTPQSIERGATLFVINCAMCHGEGGQGNGPVSKYFSEAPALNTGWLENRSDHDLFLVITNGKNRMPAMFEHLTPGETWDVVNYLRSLGPEPGSARH